MSWQHPVSSSGETLCIFCRDSILHPVPEQHPVCYVVTASCTYPVPGHQHVLFLALYLNLGLLCVRLIAGRLLGLPFDPHLCCCKSLGIFMSVLGFLTPCGLVDGYQYTLYVSALKVAPKCSFEMTVSTYRTRKCHTIWMLWSAIRCDMT
jgi:hypothetical protein